MITVLYLLWLGTRVKPITFLEHNSKIESFIILCLVYSGILGISMFI